MRGNQGHRVDFLSSRGTIHPIKGSVNGRFVPVYGHQTTTGCKVQFGLSQRNRWHTICNANEYLRKYRHCTIICLANLKTLVSSNVRHRRRYCCSVEISCNIFAWLYLVYSTYSMDESNRSFISPFRFVELHSYLTGELHQYPPNMKCDQ